LSELPARQDPRAGPPRVGSRIGPNGRLLLASSLLSVWLLLVLVGWALGGAIHLLLVAALVAFPWRVGS